MNRFSLLAAVLLVAVTAGCSSATTASPVGVPSGSYPVATPAPAILATPAVAAGGYQLVAAGTPVDVTLPGAVLRATAKGPDVQLRNTAAGAIDHEHAQGVLTVELDVTSGSLAVPASNFLVLDEKQEPITVQASPAQLTASPGKPAILSISALFNAGHTTLTWQPEGKPLITWDFTIELD